MLTARAIVARIADHLASDDVPRRPAQERTRALNRALVCGVLAFLWLVQIHWVQRESIPLLTLGLTIAYGLTSAAYGYLLLRRPDIGATLLYAFVIADPIALVSGLINDPQMFALLNPFLLTVIVGTGIRYGLRTMYLAWIATLVALLPMLSGDSWRTSFDLTLSFVLMLALVPLFFSSLVRQIHNVRAIETERARLNAMNEAVAARSAFLSKVSHELRSPLQGMVSALDLFELRHGNASLDDVELIARMRRSSLLLNTQLRDLLTLAKGEVGRLAMHPEPLEVNSLVDAMADGVRELAIAKGLELVLDLPANPVFVVADGARIDQVLTNLVTNSIRYTDKGQVRISFTGHHSTTKCLRFAIADTGPGIPQDVLPVLLAPDKMMTGVARRGEGSGIGLAVVRTLVDHLGGTIAVTSGPGLGTTFTLEIPAEATDGEECEDTEPGEPTGRVLVIDDQEDILDALIGVVDELGYECDRASSAAIGANLLAARTYDAVLFDIDMPTKSGDQLAAETRRGNGPNRDSRFVAMSAAEPSDEVRSHFHTCLAKPIDRATLRQALIGVAYFSRPSQPALWSETE
ncbi:MAG: hybrid sensor histidine kinase/response regulator [Pseudomonadota bacterium]|nr:hybrid sensor histidine kinase/response regulator [Pseudomonadota bacterium]